jgi:hypothetical protein
MRTMFRACSALAIWIVCSASPNAAGFPPQSASVPATKPPGARTAVPRAAGLTNQDVIDLTKAGFSEDLVMAKIGTAKEKAFDCSTQGLIALKTAGVTERVINVILGQPNQKASTSESSASARPSATVATGTPRPVSATRSPIAVAEGREAGIYVNDADKLTPLEPTVFSGAKTGGLFTSALTAGIKKAQWKAVVRSPQAVVRLRTSTPVFYFSFEQSGPGLSGTTSLGALLGASSPKEFVLAVMTPKKDERQLVVGEFGAFGASSGTRSKDTVEISIEKVRPGILLLLRWRSILVHGGWQRQAL